MNYTTQMKPFGNNRAFSLVELMVALVVTAIFMTGVFQILTIQQKVMVDQQHIREAQQELRVALDLITADFRSWQASSNRTMLIHFGNVDTLAQSNGLFIIDGEDGATDTVMFFNAWKPSSPYIADQEQYTMHTRLPELSVDGMSVVDNATAFGDTLVALTDPIKVQSTEPLTQYMDDMDILDFPVLAQITGAYLLDNAPRHMVGPWSFPDRYAYSSMPEVFQITGITGDNKIQHESGPSFPWNSAEGFSHRYGAFGYPPQNGGAGSIAVAGQPALPGEVPPLDDRVKIKPVQVLGWYVMKDENDNRSRLYRDLNGQPEIIAENVRDFQVNPPDPEAAVMSIVVSIWIPKRGMDPTSNNISHFHVREDSTVFIRPIN